MHLAVAARESHIANQSRSGRCRCRQRGRKASYDVGQGHGDIVREEVAGAVSQPRLCVAPNLQWQISPVAERLSSELSRGWADWYGAATYSAVRFLLYAGPVDMATCLAYFTVVSGFSLVALVFVVLVSFVEAGTIRETRTGMLALLLSRLYRPVPACPQGLSRNFAAIGRSP